MAKAEFKAPVVEREVLLTMTETQARKLYTILALSSDGAMVCYDLYKALGAVVTEDPTTAKEGWAIRRPNGHI